MVLFASRQLDDSVKCLSRLQRQIHHYVWPLWRPFAANFYRQWSVIDWTGNSLQGWKLLSFYTPHKLDTCLWWNCLDTVCCRFLPRNEFFRQTCSFWDQLKHASFKEHFNKHKPWIHQGWLINPMFNVEVEFHSSLLRANKRTIVYFRPLNEYSHFWAKKNNHHQLANH